jgi:hypothetical protein
MEIPPCFSTPKTSGKVCRLRKSLYGLKQSPHAWFDRFRRVVCGIGSNTYRLQSLLYTSICGIGNKQCNGDHIVFYQHLKGQIAILAVYVDDIIITRT